MLDDAALDILFRKARTHRYWLDKPVSDELLKKVYDLAVFGPTSANCLPMRIVFVKSPQAKEKLKPCLSPGNIPHTLAAPVTAIIGYDLLFYNNFPHLFPHGNVKSWFENNDELIKETAFRNGSLQGAYFIMAARAMGLDCGPMSGFNNALVDEAFFTDIPIKSNFLCNLGYGDHSKLYPRDPRLPFEDVAVIV